MSWRHHDDVDILKKLGIHGNGPSTSMIKTEEAIVVDKSPSEEEIFLDADDTPEADRPFADVPLPPSHSQLHDEEDDDDDDDDDGTVLFHREELLGLGGRVGWRRGGAPHGGVGGSSGGDGLARENRTRGGRGAGSGGGCGRAALVGGAFLALGLDLGLVGASVPELRAGADATLPATTSALVSANAFGAALGLSLAGACFTCANAFGLLALALFLAALSTSLLPWVPQLPSLIILSILQGAALGFIERGGLSHFQSYWRRKYHVIQFFYVCLALGGVIGALAPTPFVSNSLRFNTSTDPTPAPPTLGSSPPLLPTRVKRQANSPPTPTTSLWPLNATMTSSSMGNVSSTTALPRKPKVAEKTEAEKEQSLTEKKVEKEEKEEKEEREQENNEHLNTPTPTIPDSTLSNTEASSLPLPASSSSSSTTTTTTTPTPTTTQPTTTTSSTTTSTTRFTTSTTTTTSSSSASSMPNSSITTADSDQTGELEKFIRSRLGELSRVRVAFLLAGAVNVVLGICLALLCICTPCRSLRPPPQEQLLRPPSARPQRLCANRDLNLAVALSLALVFLLVGQEATLLNLLAPYMEKREAEEEKRGITRKTAAASGALLAAAFWGGAAGSRILCALLGSVLSTGKTVWVSACGSLAAAASVALYPESPGLLWAGVTAVGVFSGPLIPSAFCWVDSTLSPGWWLSSLWLLAGQLGRLIVPALTAQVVESRGSADILFLSVLVSSLGVLLTWVFLTRAGVAANQLLAVTAFSRSVKAANGNMLEYQQMKEESTEMEDILFDLEDEDLTFRSSDGSSALAQEDEDDIFSRYIAPGEPARHF